MIKSTPSCIPYQTREEELPKHDPEKFQVAHGE
jgi:hypothetical protein